MTMAIAGLGCPKCGRGLMPTNDLARVGEDGACLDVSACEKWTALIATRPDMQAAQARRRALWIKANEGLEDLALAESETGARFDAAYDAAAQARASGREDAALEARVRATLDVYWQAVCALANAQDAGYKAALSAAPATSC